MDNDSNSSNSSGSSNNCIICTDTKKDTILECGHSFCYKCIYTWHFRQPFCPICKRHFPLTFFGENENEVSKSQEVYLQQVGVRVVREAPPPLPTLVHIPLPQVVHHNTLLDRILQIHYYKIFILIIFAVIIILCVVVPLILMLNK